MTNIWSDQIIKTLFHSDLWMFFKTLKSCDYPFSICPLQIFTFLKFCSCCYCCCFFCSSFVLHLSPPRFTLSTGYYGLSLNTSKMHPNPFISSFLSAAVEIPAYILIWVALRFLRRKVCLLIILLLAAASLLLIQLVPEGIAAKEF